MKYLSFYNFLVWYEGICVQILTFAETLCQFLISWCFLFWFSRYCGEYQMEYRYFTSFPDFYNIYDDANILLWELWWLWQWWRYTKQRDTGKTVREGVLYLWREKCQILRITFQKGNHCETSLSHSRILDDSTSAEPYTRLRLLEPEEQGTVVLPKGRCQLTLHNNSEDLNLQKQRTLVTGIGMTRIQIPRKGYNVFEDSSLRGCDAAFHERPSLPRKLEASSTSIRTPWSMQRIYTIYLNIFTLHYISFSFFEYLTV